jgi:hypothetical protein
MCGGGRLIHAAVALRAVLETTSWCAAASAALHGPAEAITFAPRSAPASSGEGPRCSGREGRVIALPIDDADTAPPKPVPAPAVCPTGA